MQNHLKLIVMIASFLAVLISANCLAKNAEILPIKSKIVGGEVAAEGDWPWMSVLFDTYNEISTTLTADNVNYQSQPFTEGIIGSATGITVDCGIGDKHCPDATGKICLIERGDINFSVKVENCQAGGGIGAIIYNNEAGPISGTLGENFTGTIPVVSITQADGVNLQTNIGVSASLTVTEGDAIPKSAICGASFLGGKWLLTAAHCVEDLSPQQLKVSVGEYNLSNSANNAKAVKRIYMRADYQARVELNNDIALIELFDSVNNPSITLIDLAATEQFAIDNSTVTVAGWGGRQGYGPNGGSTSNSPTLLHQVDLQLRTNDECKNIMAQSSTDAFEGVFTTSDINITDSMICAYISGGGKGSCQGDSGGPLMINTNEGWQQIGIVSWGIGCAADGFPGVYTRTALFSDWVNEITQGIAIEQAFDFTIQAQNKVASTRLEVVNNSELSANLKFTINGDNNFSIANENCNIIAAGASCQLQVNYDAAEMGKHNADINIESDNSDIATSSTKISAQTIALSPEIKSQLSSFDPSLTWYSGGSNNNSAWKLDNTEAAIVSGEITNDQESIVMVTVSGAGELSFEWSVSSEENTEEPDTPFDALYLYVDGELINFISGAISYQSESVTFAAGDHNITWIYKKDALNSEGDDNAHIRSIVYTPLGGTPATPPEPTAQSKSSGGTMGWLSFIFIVAISFRRK
jgi:secreted trypsin-like serine protease